MTEIESPSQADFSSLTSAQLDKLVPEKKGSLLSRVLIFLRIRKKPEPAAQQNARVLGNLEDTFREGIEELSKLVNEDLEGEDKCSAEEVHEKALNILDEFNDLNNKLISKQKEKAFRSAGVKTLKLDPDSMDLLGKLLASDSSESVPKGVSLTTRVAQIAGIAGVITGGIFFVLSGQSPPQAMMGGGTQDTLEMSDSVARAIGQEPNARLQTAYVNPQTDIPDILLKGFNWVIDPNLPVINAGESFPIVS